MDFLLLQGRGIAGFVSVQARISCCHNKVVNSVVITLFIYLITFDFCLCCGGYLFVYEFV